MSPIALYIADGTSFLVSMLLVGAMLAVGWCALPERRLLRVGHSLLFLTGLVLGVVTGMPLPYWLLGVWLLLTLASALAMWRKADWRRGSKLRMSVMSLGIGMSVLLFGIALFQRRLPEIEIKAGQTVYVIGDSISAGLEDGELLWPDILASETGLDVVNLARAGATMPESLAQAEEIDTRQGLVIVEMGGNDILSFTAPGEYSEATQRLLENLTNRGLTVVMVEIPLPPFGHSYGIATRRWAGKYGVRLIPRNVLAEVFRGSGSTSDGLHLSPKGHRALAEAVASILQQ